LVILFLVPDIKHNQRFVIVTDYKTLLAKDTKMNITLALAKTALLVFSALANLF